MKILLAPPSGAVVVRFLQRQSQLAFSYPDVGATRSTPPSGYARDHRRVLLGEGPATFAAACRSLERWRMFEIPWVRLYWPSLNVAPGTAVGIAVRFAGLWLLNACRIVYVVREDHRFGLAYGTLPAHGARGEERFLVEIDPAGRVWFDLLAFSQPAHPLARLAQPLARRLQGRFSEASTAALQQALALPN